MTSSYFDHPHILAAYHALEAVRAGQPVEELESLTLDFKEEAGRRDNTGAYGPGKAHNTKAARALAEEAACFANSEGGVLVVGVADKATGPSAFVGTDLDAEWLREQVWESTQPRLAVDVHEITHDGVRLLLVVVQRGYRLHRSSRRFKHRIATQCVEMSAEDQRRAEETRSGYDWSAELSDLMLTDVAEGAVERARDYLRASGEDSRLTLATRPTPDLLRALNVVDGDGRLTNAGKLLFVAGGHVLVDYQRRKAPGSSSTDRVEATAPLLNAYAEIKTRIDAVNEERQLQLPSGVRPRIRLIPDRAVREALVNALIHRDYRSPDPVLVEFTGNQLVVSSPGGFPPGIHADNIISERSHPRNRSLTAVFRSLRLAEQEGVGVDRMYRDMVGAGHETPTFAERGSRVRCVLTGGEPSEPVVALMASLPPDAQDDVDLALILHTLMERPTVGPDELTFRLQKLPQEATEALRRGAALGLLQPSHGATRARPRMRLSDDTRERLRSLLPYLTTSSEEAEEFVIRHLRTNQQIKPRDIADMLGVSEVQGSRILKDLRDANVLMIGSEQRRGRGVFHIRGPRFSEAAARHGIDVEAT
ncbi:MAG TPA: ATP-binding protein [Dokdonella sp.]